MNERPQIEPDAAASAPEVIGVKRSEGPAVAALLAVGIGAFVLGVLTTLAEASTTIREWLQLTDTVGPLSGKTTFAVIAWLIAWGVLHLALRERGRLTTGVLVSTGVLLALGLLGTFPVFFQLFASE
jgi:fluoride ion exporter CrcB/FEX